MGNARCWKPIRLPFWGPGFFSGENLLLNFQGVFQHDTRKTMNEDVTVSPIKHGDFPASHVSFPEGVLKSMF